MDAGSPVSPDAGTDAGTSSNGNPVLIANEVSAGAQVITPSSNVAAIVSACSTGVVHFSAGTYTITSSIHVPSNCTLEGDFNWASIITGGTGNKSAPVFNVGSSTHVTFTRLNFQNLNCSAIADNGIPSSDVVDNTHIYLNLFDHFSDQCIPIFLFAPSNLLIERNAFNDLHADAIHVMANPDGSGGPTYNPHETNDIIRWNFGANQRASSDYTGGFIEAQLGTLGLHIYQNVYFSKASYQGMALSIASGNTPCTSGGMCQPIDNGLNGVFIDGNIILDNGEGTNQSNECAVEIMGTNPIFQNSYIRGWPGQGMYAWIFSYNASNETYGSGGTITVHNNIGCAAPDQSSFNVGPEGSGANWGTVGVTVNYSNNTYNSSCSNIPAPPALYPQMVAPPEVLDSQGGTNAIVNSPHAGPNTYWPNINSHLNYVYP